jgi:hypothetical protein
MVAVFWTIAIFLFISFYFRMKQEWQHTKLLNWMITWEGDQSNIERWRDMSLNYS